VNYSFKDFSLVIWWMQRMLKQDWSVMFLRRGIVKGVSPHKQVMFSHSSFSYLLYQFTVWSTIYNKINYLRQIIKIALGSE